MTKLGEHFEDTSQWDDGCRDTMMISREVVLKGKKIAFRYRFDAHSYGDGDYEDMDDEDYEDDMNGEDIEDDIDNGDG